MEPNPNGKVLLNTTHGPLAIELWGKECPKASRNFVQLCLEGYYDGSLVHRIVPNFIVQMGRPGAKFITDTGLTLPVGDGQAAIHESGRIPMEIHSRLRWSRRGLVGMVAMDKDDNAEPSTVVHGSQFFCTLTETPELAGKCTLFGRLAGDSIYNLIRMGDLEVDPQTEAPLYPPKIISTQVLINPFVDMIPRQLKKVAETSVTTGAGNSDEAAKSKGTKNRSLLSFADDGDAGEGGEASIKSSHDLLKNDSKLSKQSVSVPASNQPATVPNPKATAKPEASSLQFLQQMKAMQMRQTQERIDEISKELRGESVAPDTPATVSAVKPAAPASALERHRQQFLAKRASNSVSTSVKRKSEQQETETLLKLNQFRQKIQKRGEEAGSGKESASTTTDHSLSASHPSHMDICKLHGLVDCLSCRDTFGVRADLKEEDEEGWMLHRLVFDRRQIDESIKEDLRQLMVIDPREQAQKLGIKKK